MERYRYTALLKHDPEATTRVYDYFIPTEKEGIQGLESFFGARRKDFGDRLVSVALEKSLTGIGLKIVKTFRS